MRLAARAERSDILVLRDKDANTAWSAASDGTLEERIYYCHNWRGDVVALIDDTADQVEQVRYSSYGLPFGLPMGDSDSDGDLDSTDTNQIQSWIDASAYDVRGILRYYNVFNVEQCDGIVTPPLPEAHHFQPIERCESVVESMPNRPDIEHQEARAYYRPSTDTVNMPRPALFVGPEPYYATLYHELTHATGHSSRLNRPGAVKAAAFGSADYSREELVAEMGAAFICGHCSKVGTSASLSNTIEAALASRAQGGLLKRCCMTPHPCSSFSRQPSTKTCERGRSTPTERRSRPPSRQRRRRSSAGIAQR